MKTIADQINEGSPLNPVGEALLMDLSMAEYHGTHRFIGSSGIRTFLHSRPAFEGRYVSGTIPEAVARKPMKLGTTAHAASLEPDKLDEVVAIVPNELLTREGRAWDDFVAQHEGGFFVTESERQRLVAIPAELVGKNKNTKGWRELKEAHPDGIFVTTEELESAVTILPEALRNGKLAESKEVKAFKKANRDRIVLKESEMDRVFQMTTAVREHPLAGRLMSAEGMVEATIVFDFMGLAMKTRPDKLILTNPNEPWIVDLKFTVDPSPGVFARTLARMGYPIQAALYQQGVYDLTGKWPVFVFVAAQSEPPHDVWIYELSDAALEYGRGKLEEAIPAIIKCFESGDWSNPGSADIRTLELPRWTDYEDEYSTIETGGELTEWDGPR